MNEIMKKVREGYIGNPAQLVTLRRVTVNEGRARGTEIIEVRTAGGLELDILPEAGLDIGQCRYKGINMSWMSKNGYDSPAAISPYENEFVNTFPGGLVYTCGLRSAGPANRDGDEWHPLHGRYHSLQAEQVCAWIDGDEILVRGIIRETALFGHVLEVRRSIRIPVCGSSVTLEDTVTNLTPRDEEIMKIYHCNFGYPLLSEKAQLVLPEARETVPLGVSMAISWSGNTLPVLSEWRSMASGDYVLGLEPANCYINGRHGERENGTLPVLGAFESRNYTVNIEFGEI